MGGIIGPIIRGITNPNFLNTIGRLGDVAGLGLGMYGNYEIGSAAGQLANMGLNLANKYSNQTPAQTEQAIQNFKVPLDENLINDTMSAVQAQLASQGLSLSPSAAYTIALTALAPYVQQNQQQASQNYFNYAQLPIEALGAVRLPGLADLSGITANLESGGGGGINLPQMPGVGSTGIEVPQIPDTGIPSPPVLQGPDMGTPPIFQPGPFPEGGLMLPGGGESVFTTFPGSAVGTPDFGGIVSGEYPLTAPGEAAGGVGGLTGEQISSLPGLAGGAGEFAGGVTDLAAAGGGLGGGGLTGAEAGLNSILGAPFGGATGGATGGAGGAAGAAAGVGSGLAAAALGIGVAGGLAALAYELITNIGPSPNNVPAAQWNQQILAAGDNILAAAKAGQISQQQATAALQKLVATAKAGNFSPGYPVQFSVAGTQQGQDAMRNANTNLQALLSALPNTGQAPGASLTGAEGTFLSPNTPGWYPGSLTTGSDIASALLSGDFPTADLSNNPLWEWATQGGTLA